MIKERQRWMFTFIATACGFGGMLCALTQEYIPWQARLVIELTVGAWCATYVCLEARKRNC